MEVEKRLRQGDTGETSPVIQEGGITGPKPCRGNRKEDIDSGDTAEEATSSTGLSIRTVSSHSHGSTFCPVPSLSATGAGRSTSLSLSCFLQTSDNLISTL